MEKSKKTDWIAKMKQRFSESEAVFAVTQNKLTVSDTESLRKQLRAVNSQYVVAKNTLTRLAVKDTPFECIATHLSGQTAIVFSKDITSAAKAISEYAAKSEGKLSIVCGGYSGNLLSAAEVDVLAKLPSIDEFDFRILRCPTEKANLPFLLAFLPGHSIALPTSQADYRRKLSGSPQSLPRPSVRSIESPGFFSGEMQPDALLVKANLPTKMNLYRK